MLEEFAWVDEVADPRPLQRLGLVSGSVVLATVVLLVHEHRRGARGLSGGGLFAVWLVAAVAALLLLGAVVGLLTRRAAARHPRLDPEELRERQEVKTRLRRGKDLSPELREVAQRVVDDVHANRWSPVLPVVLGAYWTGTAFAYAGRSFWLHLGTGVVYLGLATWPILDRRGVLRTAARSGVRPSGVRRRARSQR